jgi:hypothetical protein
VCQEKTRALQQERTAQTDDRWRHRINCGTLLNDFELIDLGAWRQMSGLLVKLPHNAEVHHGADDSAFANSKTSRQ